MKSKALFEKPVADTIKALSAFSWDKVPNKSRTIDGPAMFLSSLHCTIILSLSLCRLISTPPSPGPRVTIASYPFFLNTLATSCSNCQPESFSQYCACLRASSCSFLTLCCS